MCLGGWLFGMGGGCSESGFGLVRLDEFTTMGRWVGRVDRVQALGSCRFISSCVLSWRGAIYDDGRFILAFFVFFAFTIHTSIALLDKAHAFGLLSSSSHPTFHSLSTLHG